MKADEICNKNMKKFGGGVGVGSGSNFALKFWYRKKWVFLRFFHSEPPKIIFSARNSENISFNQKK